MTSSEKDGMAIVEWIKLYRTRTGAGLKAAKDAHDRGDPMPPAESFSCKIIGADFDQDTVTLKMTGEYQVGAGMYRLVRCDP